MVKYFREFLQFFFPEIEKDIDFDKGYEFLDKELQKISSRSKVGKRFADILVKVFLKDGTEEWLLIHIEVQGYAAQDFSRRMFTYNYKILDKYNANVVSLAILADDNPNFRQDTYEYKRWGFHHLFHFPVVKILDYRGKEQELEGERNPFSVIVLAHLREMETKKDVEKRLLWKVSLVKALYDKGYTREDVLLLYTFTDWLMSLPKGYDRRFHEEIVRFEEVKKVPFVTTAEKIGMEKGIQQGILQASRGNLIEVLEERFGTVSQTLRSRLRAITDPDVLKSLHKKALNTGSLEEFNAEVKVALA